MYFCIRNRQKWGLQSSLKAMSQQKSSLKGKEPFNSKRQGTGESARQTEYNKVEQYTMKSLILAQDER